MCFSIYVIYYTHEKQPKVCKFKGYVLKRVFSKIWYVYNF